MIFFISALAETSRAPFDLPEAESELVAGFFTEHSSVPFVMFFLAEYASLVLMSTLTAVLFFGGYLMPFSTGSNLIDLQSLVLGLKAAFFCGVFVWVRATLPRLRYDQLMNFC